MRVLEVHRGQLLLHDGEQHLRARARAALVTELSAVADMLAVGDWVIAPRDDFGQWWVHARLQPSTQVARRQHDDRDKVVRQVIVSNVDTALLVMGLDHDFNLRRLERYLAAVQLAAIDAVVVLTKADLCADAPSRLAEVRSVLPGAVAARPAPGWLRHRHPGAAHAAAGQRERTLVGIGSRRGTNQHWARSCHEFKFYEALLAPAAPAAEAVASTQPPAGAIVPAAAGEPVSTAAQPVVAETEASGTHSEAANQLEEMRTLLDVAETAAAQRQAARDLVSKAVARLAQNRGETWIQKARLRPFIQRIDSTFHESSYGFSTFNEMLASMSDLVEVRRGEFDHELRLRPAVTEPAA